MEAIKINLEDYIHSGEGANGESFDHRTDPSIMMKLYNPGKIQQPLDEMLMARKVYKLGIPTPEPGDYVKGNWTQGHLNYGEWYSSEGTKKAFIQLGDHPDTDPDKLLGTCERP